MDVFTYIYIYIYIYITPTGETPSKTAAGAVEGEAVELATPDPLQKPLVADPGNQQDDPPSTTSQKRSPMLIVPKNWDVPIQQRMVDIFTMAKTGAPEPPRSDPEGQRPEGPRPDCPPDPEGREPEGPQPEGPRPDCPPEPEGPRPEGPHQNGTVEKMEIDDEPPVVLRTEQWKLKPAGRGRGRGKGRGGRRGRGKACTGEIMVESSADEADEGDVESKAAAAAVPTVDEDVGKKPRRQPKAKSKPKAKAKSSSSRKRSSTAEESSEIQASGDNVNQERFFVELVEFFYCTCHTHSCIYTPYICTSPLYLYRNILNKIYISYAPTVLTFYR